MSAISLFDLNGEQRFAGTQVGGTQTVSITTSPTTWDHGAVIFDLAQATIFNLKTAIVAEVPDGETFGNAGDDSQLGIIWTPEVSIDGVTWVAPSPLISLSQVGSSGTPTVVGDFQQEVSTTFRYVHVTDFLIVHSVSDTPYAGPHHPTVTLQISVGVLP